MAFVNLPPNLQDIFNLINDRVSKLETGPNQAMYTAVNAQNESAQALANAAVALAEAQGAYTLASQAIIGSQYTILNAQNQLTEINGNGVTVFSGAQSTSGARVVMNSAGIAGFNSSDTATFTLDATNGNVSITGASFTSGTISGGSLNISGNCIINTSGLLTATGATITGTLTSSAGNLGGWNLSSSRLYNGSSYLDSGGNIVVTGIINATGNVGGGSLASAGTLTVSGASTVNTLLAQGELYAQYGALNSVTNAANTWISSSGQIRLRTASSQRYKENIVDIATVEELNPNKLLSIPVRAFTYKDEVIVENDDRAHVMIPGFIAEELDAIYPIATDYEDGQPRNWNDSMLVPAMLALIQTLEKRITELENK